VAPDRVAFSWLMESDRRNQRQTAFEIGVSSSEAKLAQGAFDAWHSGRKKGSQSVLVRCGGPPLAPATRYFWQVRIWDADGQASAWSPRGSFVTALGSAANWGDAKWIGYEQMPPSERLVPGIHQPEDRNPGQLLARPVVPLFRKAFTARSPVVQALAFVCGLGQYEMYLNGARVGDAFLAPSWTDYDKRCLYNVFDLTGSVKEGANVVGAIVGNGFHHVNRDRYYKIALAYGYPRLILLLQLRYADGSTEQIITGPGWKATPSPVTFSNIYGGEDYDARAEKAGWTSVGYDDSAWRQAIVVEAPAGRLEPDIVDPVKPMQALAVKRVIQTGPRSFLYDFGQNCSGIVELTVEGRAGQSVKMTPAELIDRESHPNQKASGRPYWWAYTLKGEGVETWAPRFTYYGFRYVEVEGAVPADQKGAEVEAPVVHGLRLLHTHSSAPKRGQFSCSFELFNRIDGLIDWAVRSNLASVLTDCPHREKLGWLEQTHLMGDAIHFNYDLYRLFGKQVNDMVDAQTPSGLVPDIAPEYVEFQAGFRDSPEWGSAAVLVPWMLYRWYGDTVSLTSAYPMMSSYVNYLKTMSDGYILSHGLGDWYDLGPRFPGEAQLTPKALTATALFYEDARILSEAARVLGHAADAERYARLAADIKEAFNQRFYDGQAASFSTGSQTAMAMPLCLGLVREKDRPRVFRSLLGRIETDRNALTAGDIGFHYLVKALADGGAGELLFAMNSREDVPGYGYQLKRGATALTESWAALEQVSNNHLMLGHLREWFFSGLAGIGQAGGSVAYEKIVIRPQLIRSVEWVRGEFESPRGRIAVSWRRTGNTAVLDVEIPVNSTAEIHIPAPARTTVRESGREIRRAPRRRGRVIVPVGSGSYHFDWQEK